MEKARTTYLYLPYCRVQCSNGEVEVFEKTKRYYSTEKGALDVAARIAVDMGRVSSEVEVTPGVKKIQRNAMTVITDKEIVKAPKIEDYYIKAYKGYIYAHVDGEWLEINEEDNSTYETAKEAGEIAEQSRYVMKLDFPDTEFKVQVRPVFNSLPF